MASKKFENYGEEKPIPSTNNPSLFRKTEQDGTQISNQFQKQQSQRWFYKDFIEGRYINKLKKIESYVFEVN